MAFTEFCCRSGGSNLNAGTRTGSSTEPGTTADFTYASGDWVASTGVFTVASGNPSTDGVAAGDFASVYADGSTVTGFVGRVTAVTATTITVSLTVKGGTAPTDGTGNRTVKIGGAWEGPNGAIPFPFGTFAVIALKNVNGDHIRVNFKDSATYDVTAASYISNAAGIFQGYSTSYGDGGKATISGGSTGASFSLIFANATFMMVDFIFSGNGATGSLALVGHASGSALFYKCVFTGGRGSGLVSNAGIVIECESYGNNLANATAAGFEGTSVFIHCISHDNAGSNSAGFRTASNLFNCISDSNGGHGFTMSANTTFQIHSCDAYNNAGSGLLWSGAYSYFSIANCNFVKNGGYGISITASTGFVGTLSNCGFGSGTQANTSGDLNAGAKFDEAGLVTYPSDVTPWTDPGNGDFRVSLAEAKGAGRGAFTQTATSYTGTTDYSDIGAAQAAPSGGGAHFSGFA